MSDEKEVVVVDPTPMQLISQVVDNPDFDVEKLAKMMDLQERYEDRRAEIEFNKAFNRVQAKLPTVVENCDNSQTKSKYANIKALSTAIKPVYTAEGFSTSFSEGKSELEGQIRINGVLRHTGGHKEPYSVELPRDDAGMKGTVNKTPTHAASSTLTYGRRILTLMIFDVAPGDDTDGNMPSIPITEEQAANIEALLDETGADKVRFLKYAGADSIEEIDEKYYSTCVKMLEKKRASS